jgi:serine/threonine protein kinase
MQIGQKPFIYNAIMMEFVEGESLENTTLSPDDAQILLKSIAQQLACIHSIDIIHRDIKPANIIFDHETKNAKLIDYGISCQLGNISEYIPKCNSTVAGTMPLWAPELLGQYLYNTNKDIEIIPSPASDIWALGNTLYHILTGRYIVPKNIPLNDNNIKTYIDKVQSTHFLPADYRLLENIIKSMIEYDPKNRPSALDILTLL